MPAAPEIADSAARFSDPPAAQSVAHAANSRHKSATFRAAATFSAAAASPARARRSETLLIPLQPSLSGAVENAPEPRSLILWKTVAPSCGLNALRVAGSCHPDYGAAGADLGHALAPLALLALTLATPVVAADHRLRGQTGHTQSMALRAGHRRTSPRQGPEYRRELEAPAGEAGAGTATMAASGTDTPTWPCAPGTPIRR